MAMQPNYIDYLAQMGMLNQNQYNQLQGMPYAPGTKMLSAMGRQMQAIGFNAQVSAAGYQMAQQHLLNDAINQQQSLNFNMGQRNIIGGISNLMAHAQNMNNAQNMQSLQSRAMQQGMAAQTSLAQFGASTQEMVGALTNSLGLNYFSTSGQGAAYQPVPQPTNEPQNYNNSAQGVVS